MGTSDVEGLAQVTHAATLPEAFQRTVAKHGDKPAIRTQGDGLLWTWREYGKRVETMAAALAGFGVARGDTVGLMLTNRPEFHVVDAAAIHLGAAAFSIYNTFPVEQVSELLRNSGCRLVVTEQSFLTTVSEASAASTGCQVVVVDGGAPDGVMTLAELLDYEMSGFDFEAAWKSVASDDLLTIIYTSGTTGAPKGVEITHANELASINGYLTALPFPEEGRVLSWLPMAHVAERSCSHYFPMVLGYTSTCCPDATQLGPYLVEVRPTWFFAVPRVWEKLRAGLQAAMARETDEAKKQGTAWALEVGMRRTRAQQEGVVPSELEAEFAVADQKVLQHLRAAIGFDKFAVVNVGSAPSTVEVLEFFHAIGIPISELWAMSESSAGGTANPPGRVKLGTVGTALPGFELKLANDGELLLRGGGIMRGYRGEAQLTAETIDSDGWLHSGDLATIDSDGYVTLVDRKKEIAITSSGKNLSPARIEAIVKGANPLFSQVVAIADGRRYVVALITIDRQMLGAWATGRGIDVAALEPIEVNEAIRDVVAGSIATANAKLARFEQVKAFRILPGEWAPGGEELTPTMKLKRRAILDEYLPIIDALYAETDAAAGGDS